MAVYNIDETIKVLLNAYICNAGKILKQEYKNITANEEAKIDNYVESGVAYEFLRQVSFEPKQYLYKKENIQLSHIDGKTIYENLKAICDIRFDNGANILVKLSNAISSHVRFVGEDSINKPWVWDEKGLFDAEAKEILELNKQMQIINAKGIVKVFNNLMSPVKFAVKNKQNVI